MNYRLKSPHLQEKKSGFFDQYYALLHHFSGRFENFFTVRHCLLEYKSEYQIFRKK